MATTASVYNASRTTRQVLKRHRKEGPSLTLHLYANTFRFDRQNGAFLCESPLKNLLYFIRDQKVPADLVDIFDEARVPFFEGCLIIEVHDHRPPSVSQSSAFPTPATRAANSNAASSPDEGSSSVLNTDSSARVLGGNYGFLRRLGADAHQRNGDQPGAGGSSSPSVYRIVLYPSAETLWTDLRMLNEVEGAGLWRDEDVLEIESRILALTSPPLCLTPDLQASRIANVMLSATAPPCAYSPSSTSSLPYFSPSIRKRGINSIEVEMDESNKKRREKIMRMMEKGSSSKAKEAIVGSSTHAPSFARMAFVERWRASKAANDANASIKLSDGLHGDMSNATATDEQRAAPKKKPKKKKAAAAEDEAQEAKDASPAPASAAKKKSSSSSKKKAQKDSKDQAAEQEQAEREAAAVVAATKVKEEETIKKSKKGKKKDQAAQQQQAQQQAAQAQAQAMAMAQVQALAQAQADAAEAETNKKSGKKTAKLKKAKIQPSPAANPSNLSELQQQQQQQQQPYGGAPPPQMYQQMLNYQAQAMNQGSPASGLSAASYPGLFAGNVNGGGLALPGQGGNYTNVQQQIQQAAAAAQGDLQQQPTMNGNFMMNPQMQQHLQALAAMQQQNMSHSPQSMPASQPLQQGQFNAQDNALPVGVGLGNLPPNWKTMA